MEPVWTRPAANAYMTDEKIETCGMMVPAGLVELKDQRSISHVAVYLKAGICKTIEFGLPVNVK